MSMSKFSQKEDDSFALFLLASIRAKKASALTVYHEIPRGFFFWEGECLFVEEGENESFFSFFVAIQRRGPLVPEFPKRTAEEWADRYREIMLDQEWWLDYFERQRLAKGAGPAMKMIELSMAVKGEDGKRLLKQEDLIAAGMTEDEIKKGKGFMGGMTCNGQICKVSDF